MREKLPTRSQRQGFDKMSSSAQSRCCTTPGISIARAANIACDGGGVNAMHDPTEGGVATGLLELATAAGVGLSIDAARIPVLPECRIICDALALDPLGLIASGALLVALPPSNAERLIAALSQASIPANIIGSVTPPSDGLRLIYDGTERSLPTFPRDELARFFTEINSDERDAL